MTHRLLLVGGSAGSGKSTVARSLASQLGAGWLQLDTVWVALKAAAGQGTLAYDELAVDQRMADENPSDEAILAAHMAAAETVCRVLPEVFAFELTTHGVLVVDGAWLVPSFVAGLALDDTDVAAVYLQHTSLDGVSTALAPRLAGRERQARHVRMDRRIWQYGDWLTAEARRHGFPVLDPLPFETLEARVTYALGIQESATGTSEHRPAC
jgi:2-phosphoglycerate kinase